MNKLKTLMVKAGSVMLPVLAAGQGGYNESFTVADVDDVIIDFIVTYAAQFVTFAGLIALAVIGGFFLRKTRMLRR